MIYFLVGNDNKKKNIRVEELSLSLDKNKIGDDGFSREIFLDLASRRSLFGNNNITIIEGFLKQKDTILKAEDWILLKESENTFIFIEESILLSEEKRYKKYATIEKFEKKEVKKVADNKVFGISDLYARKDKIGTWVLYRDAIEKGITPENISGILFWKIKTMILNNNKSFTQEALKHQSSSLVSLHHRAHRGEVDFVIGLEQFILKALS